MLPDQRFTPSLVGEDPGPHAARKNVTESDVAVSKPINDECGYVKKLDL